MSKDDKIAKLLARARQAPASLKFAELCWLAEAVGYVWKRTNGSHVLYVHPSAGRMNFQTDGGDAKAYQVTQLVDSIYDNGLTNRG